MGLNFRANAVATRFGAVLTLVACLLVPSLSIADPVLIVVGVRVANSTGKPQTDLHVQLDWDTNITIVQGNARRPTTANNLAPNGAGGAAGVVGSGTKHVQLNWTIDTPVRGLMDLRIFATEEHYNVVRSIGHTSRRTPVLSIFPCWVGAWMTTAASTWRTRLVSKSPSRIYCSNGP
jgi:hypothetical protein